MREYLRQLPSHHQSRGSAGLAFRLHLDAPLLAALLLLSAGGLFVLYSAGGESTGLVTRQAVRLGLGFTALFLLAQIPPRTYRFWAPVVYAIGVVMLVLVLTAGTEAKGAQRWLSLPGLGRFQPSEIMKLALPAMVAWYFSERSMPPRFMDVLAALGIILLPAVMIAAQPDLGTAILIATSGLIVLFMAGLSWRIIASVLVILAVAAPLMYNFVLHDYQRQRVDTFFNPEADRLGAGWNIIQSKTAIGSGGWEGKGWLNGTQSQLDFLPESHTDFIIAVLAEEFGLRGVLVLLALYLLIILRGFWIGVNAGSNFGRMVAGSLTLTFFVYIFVNMGMVAGLLPVVGVPLPLVSAGGTSVVTLMAGFGVLMAVATADTGSRR